jgi:cytochrome c oxidase subunit 2
VRCAGRAFAAGGSVGRERRAGLMPLHFGNVQLVALGVYAGLAVAFALVFLVVAVKANEDVPLEQVQRSGYWLRRRWIAVLVALLVCLLGFSFLDLPYAGSASGKTIVKVTGGQFFWVFDPSQVPAGSHVRFHVTSVDVNHGFGIFDPDGRLLGSVQAMPGYHNDLDLDLDQAGTYQIRCFEFCGLHHHDMQAVFRVVSSG